MLTVGRHRQQRRRNAREIYLNTRRLFYGSTGRRLRTRRRLPWYALLRCAAARQGKCLQTRPNSRSRAATKRSLTSKLNCCNHINSIDRFFEMSTARRASLRFSRSTNLATPQWNYSIVVEAEAAPVEHRSHFLVCKQAEATEMSEGQRMLLLPLVSNGAVAKLLNEVETSILACQLCLRSRFA